MKKNYLKRVIVSVLLMGLLMGLMTACGGSDDAGKVGNDNTQVSTDKSDDKGSDSSSDSGGYQTTFGSKKFDDVTITVMVFDRSNAPDGQTATNNIWTEYINEKMNEVGINVEFIAVPRSDELNKVNTMMASGTAADIMLTYTGSIVEDFYNKGGVHELTDYVKGEGQVENLKAYFGADYDNLINVGTNSDGEVWAIPAKRSTTARSNMFIRKDWLDELGMDIPTTIDELYDALYAFKNNNPDGRTDVIAGSFWTYGAAGPVAHSFLESVADEKEYAISNMSRVDGMWAYTDPGYGEYLRWLNKLYNDGLLDPEFYVDEDFSQKQKEQFVNGQLGFLEYDVNGNVDTLRGGLLQNLKANDPDAEFVSIKPMENVNDGVVYNNAYPLNGAFVFIPKTCKNVEAAVTYLDWLATEEGGFTLFHGFEGEHFEYVDGVPVVLDMDHNAETKDWTRHDLFLVGNQGYYEKEEDFNNATSKEIPGWEQYVLDNYQNATHGKVLNEPTFASPTATENSANLLATKDVYIVQLVTCEPSEFDGIMEEFKAELEKYEIEKILEERTEYYNEFYGN